jgi:uncharacterized protein (DUF169 family)
MAEVNWQELAESLQRTLGLQHRPIAITFSDEAPSGVGQFESREPPPTEDGRTGKVPAGCVFWTHAEERTFTTVPEDHYNCSVGSVTHGLKTLQEVGGNGDVAALLESGWVSMDEAMGLPAVSHRHNFISYGPLAETPIDPDVILLRVNAFQAMVLQDAFGEMDVVGKPQCHIIPLAREQGHLALSTGCMLSRVRTGMKPDEMTCTIPANRLPEVIDKLEARRQANATVAAYANQDRARFA